MTRNAYEPGGFPRPAKTITQMVREFHETFNCPIAPGGYSTAGTVDLRRLRYALVAEEVGELRDALALRDGLDGPEDDPERIADLEAILDALADIVYVAFGAALSFGLPLEEAIAEVHRSNMSKLGEDGKPVYRDDRKVLKGPNYSPPNLRPLLNMEPLTFEGEVGEL